IAVVVGNAGEQVQVGRQHLKDQNCDGDAGDVAEAAAIEAEAAAAEAEAAAEAALEAANKSAKDVYKAAMP
ncbi:MAG: hypothetical protein IJC70_06025, partial [Firmicutes bacterium]|nr:hypothetical protein [Bacillota bacterium]